MTPSTYSPPRLPTLLGRSMALAFAAIATLTSAAQAAVVSIPDVEVLFGQTSVEIPIFVEGGDPVSNASVVIQVGDGGTVTGNPQVPEVSAFSIATSFLQNLPSGVDVDPSAYPPPDEIVDIQLNASAAGESAAATGVLLTFMLDLSVVDLQIGDSYALLLMDAFGQPTQLFDITGADRVTQLIAGSFTVVPVPEPASLALLGGGAVLLIRRRRAVQCC